MISENLEDLNYNNIIIYEPIKNSILNHSYFYKIIFSNHLLSLNGLFCTFELTNSSIINDKCNFDLIINDNIIKKLQKFENYLLDKILINNEPKHKIYKLYDNIISGTIKFNYSDYCLDKNSFFNNNNYNYYNNLCNNKFILKISGIWETKENIGITYKFILIKSQLDI
jgi:hypothetical protein